MLYARSTWNGISHDPGVERSSYSHGVCPRGAIIGALREVADLRGSRGTLLLEHSPVADSQSNGFIERGIRSVEEMTRVILFHLSSRVRSPISVHSPVFPWTLERAKGHFEQMPCGE